MNLFSNSSTTETLLFLVFIIFSLHSVLSDLQNLHIQVIEVVIGAAIVMLIKFLMIQENLLPSIIASSFAVLVFLGIQKISKGRFGTGDIFYSGFIALTFGFWIWDISALLGAILGGIWIMGRFIMEKLYLGSSKKKALFAIRIPFVPCLFTAIVILFCYSMLAL